LVFEGGSISPGGGGESSERTRFARETDCWNRNNKGKKTFEEKKCPRKEDDAWVRFWKVVKPQFEKSSRKRPLLLRKGGWGDNFNVKMETRLKNLQGKRKAVEKKKKKKKKGGNRRRRKELGPGGP